MSTIKPILFLLSLFIFPVIGNNCSCGSYIGTFCQNLPSIDGAFDFHVVSAKVTQAQHGDSGQYMQIEVLEDLYNNIGFDSITVIGQDGINCGELLGHFMLDDEYIFYLIPGYFVDAPDTLYLDGCGRSWLHLEGDMVNGPIRPGVESEDYQMFKDSLLACSNFITSTDDMEQLTQSVHVFPNPVQDILNIESSDYAIQQITLFSITGQKIAEKQGNFRKNISLDLEGLSAGLYFVNIRMNGQVVSKKVVKY